MKPLSHLFAVVSFFLIGCSHEYTFYDYKTGYAINNSEVVVAIDYVYFGIPRMNRKEADLVWVKNGKAPIENTVLRGRQISIISAKYKPLVLGYSAENEDRDIFLFPSDDTVASFCEPGNKIKLKEGEFQLIDNAFYKSSSFGLEKINFFNWAREASIHSSNN